MSNSTNSKLAQQFAKPIMNGAVSYIGSMALGNSGNFNILGKNFDVNIGYAITGVGTDFIAELGHNWILPHLPATGKFANTEALLLAPALGAAGNVGLVYFLDKNRAQSDGLMVPALLGAGSVVVTQYAYDAFLSPYIQ